MNNTIINVIKINKDTLYFDKFLKVVYLYKTDLGEVYAYKVNTVRLNTIYKSDNVMENLKKCFMFNEYTYYLDRVC